MTNFPANTDLQIALLIATTLLAMLLTAEWIAHRLSPRMAPVAQQRRRVRYPSTSSTQRKF